MCEPSPSPLVADALPQLACELEGLLTEQGEPELAAQVPSLRIVERCRCGDDFCSTFYTQPKPKGRYGSKHHCVLLEPERGMLILDVVGGRIACVEVLYRDEVRRALQAILP